MAHKIVTGNYAAAYGAMRSRVRTVAAYPITPQTFIVEHLSEFINNGELDSEYIEVESEHSAMSACVSASATGVRTFTATSSQGLALMHEILPIASGLRLPIVMSVVNRAIAAPINIWVEHNDIMPERDSGWLQVFCDHNQEVQDMILQAFRIAEDKRVALPVAVCLDAFILSHTVEPVDLMCQEDADRFLPKYSPPSPILDPNNPTAVGVFVPPEYMMECRWQMDNAMRQAPKVIEEVNKAFAKEFGRDYGGMIDPYMCDDADVVLITLGTVGSTTHEVVDVMRAEGKKVGMVKLRFWRPYPAAQLRKIAEKVKAVGVFDRAVSYGVAGPSFIEFRNAAYGLDVPTMNVIGGLGGNDVSLADIRSIFDKLLEIAKTGVVKREIVWLNTRGVE
ncbi:MAG: pyruvate ferredoxin oxidoreductase [Thermoplasmata archaeon]|nr:pyruvate ferredoxin oxidoreductase [Thermoplasmata archaeon]MCJ7561730.1 pyruvate ferredoxin oxidoreductase [Thermoplasmata archaeon]TFG67509.1 MAG: pyruvate ferredoxin oxidoreductase [Methanomassiliicoccus sp.]